MRRIGVLSDPAKVQEVSRLFTHYDIPFTIDCKEDTSWDSESYGQSLFSVFIEDEHDLERAQTLLNEAAATAPEQPCKIDYLTGPCEHAAQNYLQQRFGVSFHTKRHRSASRGFITLLLAMLCICVFILDIHSRVEMPIQASSPIQKALFFDYPDGLQIKDTLLETYKAPLKQAPQSLVDALKTTDVWGGIYHYILDKGQRSEALPHNSYSTALMLERVRDGQAWRLVSPCILHGNVFHLAFNMLWLIALGIQIEKKLSFLRFTILLTAIAIISNISQYCMSGPNFFGCSGVIFGLIGFIAKRNELFPWEGYSLQSTAYSCVLFFMWTLVFLSFCSFLATWYLNAVFSIGFANTAHVAGLFAGIQLGKNSFFCAKKTRDIV